MACVLLCIVGWATPGRAQAVRSVEGGGSFFAAAAVEEGRYRDTILPGETSFYAVELEAGQVLRVEVQMELERGVERKELLPAYPKLTLYGPDRSERATDQATWIVEIDSRKLKARSRRIGGAAWPPGTYFFTITLGDQAATLKRREYDVRIKVQIRGRGRQAPVASPSPTLVIATPTPTPTPTPDPTQPLPPSPSPEPPSDGASAIPWLVGSFALGGFVGAGGRLLLARRGT